VNTDTRWRRVTDTQLIQRVWDDEVVIYHPESGDTHLLNPAAAEMLQVLEQGPASSKALSEHIATRFDVPLDEKLRDQVEETLTGLGRVGLIKKISQ
jgi:PqqD family protein of HPr-rel-A system